MAVNSRDLTIRHCPACHSLIEVSSVVCRFCGRNVPPLLAAARQETEGGERHEEGPPLVNEFNVFVRDLCAAAREGGLEPTLCREAEVEQLLRLIRGEERESALIVGPDGVGKTNLVYGAATALAVGGVHHDPTRRLLIQLYSEILEGHHERIPLRLKSLAHLLGHRRDLVIFLDDFGPLLRAGINEVHGAGQLLELVESGQMRCVGTLTDEVYEELEASASRWLRRFTVIRLTPPDAATTLRILTGLQGFIERRYEVPVSRQALAAAVDLSQAYLPREVFPGKAVEVLRQACGRYRRKIAMREDCPPEWLDDATMNLLGVKVGAHDVKRVVGELTAMDIGAAEAERWERKVEERLNRHVLSQKSAMKTIAAAVTRMRLDYGAHGRSAGVMLFSGPKGVGKLHTARVLARNLLGGLDDFVYFNMAEYSGRNGTERFFGTIPEGGGDIESGVFTHAVRDTPLAVVAFGGIEAAHPGFIYELLRGLKTGVIRDNRGQELSLRNCLMILTLNTSKPVEDGLADAFGPGLGKLLQDAVPVSASFAPLTPDAVHLILQHAMQEFYGELRPLEVHLRVQGRAYELLSSVCHSSDRGLEDLGGRLGREVFEPIRQLVQTSQPVAGRTFDVLADGDRIRIEASGPRS